MKNRTCYTLVTVCLSLLCLLQSCSQKADTTADEPAEPNTPVQVTTVSSGTIADTVVLNATSAYLEKSYVKANTNGYVQNSSVKIGNMVSTGQVLFKVITKEARAIGNSINQLDPGFKFSGVSSIRAENTGFITQVNHQKGDYVQDGEQMAVISNRNSLVFLLDLPYEMRSSLPNNQTLSVTLPDGEKLSGSIISALPAVDSLAQTQRMVIRVNAGHPIPENLNGKVSVVKSAASNVQLVPRAVVLTNETEDEFWVMKLINDSTAVKTIIKKGIENAAHIQVLSPRFVVADRLIMTGNYGLADTAKVKITR